MYWKTPAGCPCRFGETRAGRPCHTDMLALSIRQPFAELILRGIKTVEYRSRPTRRIGERFHIYAAGKWPAKWPVAGGALPGGRRAWSGDLAQADVPPWMIELADGLRLFPHELPTGVIVGTAVIERCEPADASGQLAVNELAASPCPPIALYKWHLVDVQRARRLRKPVGHPQPVWFRAF